jgi:hypothetical protein
MGHGALKLAVRPPEGMWPDGAALEVTTRPQQGRPLGAMKIATGGPPLLRNIADVPQGQMPGLLMWNTGTIFVRGAVAPRKLLETEPEIGAIIMKGLSIANWWATGPCCKLLIEMELEPHEVRYSKHELVSAMGVKGEGCGLR